MLRRSALVVSLLVVCACGLTASAAHAQTGTYWCSVDPALKTCVVSASLDGAGFTPSDPRYDVWALPAKISGAKTVQWSVQPVGPSDLSAELGHTFSVTIRTNVVPREEDGFGASETITRSGPSGGKYTVTITGQPVEVSDQTNCTFPPGGPTCTGNAPGSNAIFQGEISDYNYSSYSGAGYPPGFVDSFNGMDMWTNIAETGLPPSLIQSNGQNELQIDLTDYHFEHDGTTRVHGDFYLRIPATFLSTYWGINDPATLATDGLNASVGAGGGTLSVTVEPGNTGVQVQISNLTFSRRHLKIKLGRVTPRAPTHIRAKRIGGASARVTFKAAKPRGQKVKGYQLRCKPSGGGTTVTATSKRSPLTVTALVGSRYRCTLRARSKAGYGARSRVFNIPA